VTSAPYEGEWQPAISRNVVPAKLQLKTPSMEL